jgi:choline kinase
VKALLLAAGIGSRMGADVPKALQEIGPRSHADATPTTLLARQVALLQSCGVTDIAVVVGWRQQVVRDHLASAGVTFVENQREDIRTSGTADSFQFAVASAFEALDGREPCLLMDGDLVYERRVLESGLREGAGESVLLVAPDSGGDDEEVRVYAEDGRPKRIGKALGGALTKPFELLGEATGIVRFEPGGHAFVRETLAWLLGPDSPRGIASEHEELSQLLIDAGRVAAVLLDSDRLFSEVDFEVDLERVRNDLYPRILDRDASL